LENAVIQIAAWTDERGLLIASKPRKLVIPPALQFVATRLLDTELRVATADNDINALRTNGAIPEGYSVNHFLTDGDAYFLTTDVPNGMKHFERTPLTTSMDGDFDTGNVRYKARERYSFGWSDPLGMWGSAGCITCYFLALSFHSLGAILLKNPAPLSWVFLFIRYNSRMQNWRKKIATLLGLLIVLPVSPTIFVITVWLNS
jgi:hypothetical protein